MSRVFRMEFLAEFYFAQWSFGITRERDNAKDLTSSRSDLYIAHDGAAPPEVLITKRIGIKKAADMALRYVVPGNRFVSG